LYWCWTFSELNPSGALWGRRVWLRNLIEELHSSTVEFDWWMAEFHRRFEEGRENRLLKGVVIDIFFIFFGYKSSDRYWKIRKVYMEKRIFCFFFLVQYFVSFFFGYIFCFFFKNIETEKLFIWFCTQKKRSSFWKKKRKRKVVYMEKR
jgi:hypothetical protein